VSNKKKYSLRTLKPFGRNPAVKVETINAFKVLCKSILEPSDLRSAFAGSKPIQLHSGKPKDF